jgi:hypothetical protein
MEMTEREISEMYGIEETEEDVDPCNWRSMSWPERKQKIVEMVGEGVAQSPTAAIRAKCLDCSCGQSAEVGRCELVKCALWPFRFGKNPFRSTREYSEEERAVMAERLAVAREVQGK